MQGAVAGRASFAILGAPAEGGVSPSRAVSGGPIEAGSGAPNPGVLETRPGVKPNPSRRTKIYVGAAVAVIVVIIILAYVLSGGFHRSSGSPSDIILPSGTSYAMGAGQSTGVTLAVTTPSVLKGTFQTGGAVVVYTMSPTQYEYLVKEGNLSGYAWTSGQVPSQSYYNLSVSLAVGSWVLVFVNPNTINPTAVTFYTSVTLTPT